MSGKHAGKRKVTFLTHSVSVYVYTGCANKNNLLGEIFFISVTVTDFFTKIAAFTVEDSGHILLQYLLWFKHSNYLNL